jgi:hypothetical protein
MPTDILLAGRQDLPWTPSTTPGRLRLRARDMHDLGVVSRALLAGFLCDLVYSERNHERAPATVQEMSDAHDYFRKLMDKANTSHAGRVLKLGMPFQGPTGSLTFCASWHFAMQNDLTISFFSGMHDFRHIAEQARRSSSSSMALKVIDLHTMLLAARNFGYVTLRTDLQRVSVSIKLN